MSISSTFFTLLILSSAFVLFLGFFVLFKKSKKTISYLFFILCLGGVFWAFAILMYWISESHIDFWSNATFIGPMVLIWALACFSFVFPKKKPFFNLKLAFALLIPPIIVIILAILQLINTKTYNPWTIERGFGIHVFNLVFVSYIVLSCYNFYVSLKNSFGKDKTRIKLIFLAFFLAILVGGTFNLFLPLLFGYSKYTFLGPSVAIFIFVGFIGYTILRYNVFEVRYIATELFVFALWIVLIIRTSLSDTLQDFLLSGIILLATVLIGFYLIGSVTKEIKQKEEIEKLAKKLQKANKHLRELDKMKTEFLSLATHQIRSPLTSMRGYISMILEGDYGEIKEELREPLGIVDESSQSLVKVVNDFLNVSRIEQGRMKYDMEERSIKDVVEKVVNEYRPAVEEKGLNIHLEQTDEECISKLDGYKMEQVIGNLIDNAIKYTPEGEIRVKTSKTEDNMVRIEISDTGVGIKPEEIPKLFAKFQRAKGAEKTNVTGTGLGIYLAQMIARDHGGDVRVYSEGEGKGTTFTVELPLVG